MAVPEDNEDAYSTEIKCAVVQYSDGILHVPVREAVDVLSQLRITDMQAAKQGATLGSLNDQTRWNSAVLRAKRQARAAALNLVWLFHARSQSLERSRRRVRAKTLERYDNGLGFQPTADQKRCFEEIWQDLGKTDKPMDRVLIGDVGFGKTAVALRAALHVISDGSQVALLCPTTVLAAQHLITTSKHLLPFLLADSGEITGRTVPSPIVCLTRFTTPAERTRALEGLADGSVKVVVGTQAILNSAVKFKKLGLAIIDEEHRFGVLEKEKLKSLDPTVDVLTISATPIPRTLYLGSSGMRSMSLLRTPPAGRLPVKTKMLPIARLAPNSQTDEGLESLRKQDGIVPLEEALQFELGRGGQVLYVTRRIRDLQPLVDRVRLLCPGARILSAHGSSPDLERLVFQFSSGEADILISTNIVESGLDIPRANTIIIDEADKFGLAQLHQLRGRVGRRCEQGFAYVCYKANTILSEVAQRRLDAFSKFSGLGSGHDLAHQDLEIRGAGSAFGVEQSGEVAAIGMEMYLRLLKEAIHDIRTARSIPVCESPSLELSRLLDPDVRLGAIDRLAAGLADEKERVLSAQSTAEVDSISAEWREMMAGERLPPVAHLLLVHQRVSLMFREIGVTRASRTKDGRHISLFTTLSAEALARCQDVVAGDRLVAKEDFSSYRSFWEHRCVHKVGRGIIVRGIGERPILTQYTELLRHFGPVAKGASKLRAEAQAAYARDSPKSSSSVDSAVER